MDNEAELLKIQIFADWIHTQYNVIFSFLFGFVITGVFFSMAALVEHLISLELNIVLIIAIMVIFITILLLANRDYLRDIEETFDMIDALVEKNELPNLEKIKIGRKPKAHRAKT